MIISVSRRCDIPRFQFDWFLERLNEGFIEIANPYNANQISRVSLLLNDVDAFAFWTRDPKHILANTDELEKRGYPFYVMVSLTNYPNILEPNMPPAPEVINTIKELSRKIGKDRVIWRYDPIILTSATDVDFHRRNFAALAQNLKGAVNRVIISIYDEYKKAAKRLNELEQAGKLLMINAGNVNVEDINVKNNFHDMLASLAKSAQANSMHIQSCAEKENFSSLGIKPGACVDASLIEKIRGGACAEQTKRDKYQRPFCLCCQSKDIGAYNTCAAHCVYCYAS